MNLDNRNYHDLCKFTRETASLRASMNYGPSKAYEQLLLIRDRKLMQLVDARAEKVNLIK